MSDLNLDLLSTREINEFDFASAVTGKVRGSYVPLHFVVRLRSDLHKILREQIEPSKLTNERVQAFSTYIHENIHWWQHVGSNIGFITSLNYPAIAQIAQHDLRVLIERNEKFKSILQYDSLYARKFGKSDNKEINRILNTWYDSYYAKRFILKNSSIEDIIKDKRFFLSIGHCFNILWTSTIHTLASTIDPTYSFLPTKDKWEAQFRKMDETKVDGFYIGSKIAISPLGTKAIFEGQAMFNQLQYLSIYNKRLSYKDFENCGMLHGVYIEAFEVFLKITGIAKPTNVNNSTIGLFLLVCDIAINPTDGFPTDVLYFPTFVISNDPGIRFVMLCQKIAQDKDTWATAIVNYSSTEYIELSRILSESISCTSPHAASLHVASWPTKFDSVRTLMEEEKELKFSATNMAVRLYFSKYIRLQQDKSKYPNFFCWPGKCMGGEGDAIALTQVEELFERHKALYVDDVDGEIKPALFKEYPEENTIGTFNQFYRYNTAYDMIIRWITERGPFTYNYEWLSTTHSHESVKNWVRENFKNIFNIYPEELKIL